MSNLDQKLDKIIEDAYNREADLLISDDFKDEKRRQDAKENYQVATKSEIKQAFKEAGYILFNTDGCAHFDMTDGVCEQGHQRRVCDFCGKDFHVSKIEWDTHLPATPVMTGQQWYDRFEMEIDHFKKQLSRLTSAGIGTLDQTQIDGFEILSKQAARRAAGIEEEK